MKTEDINKTMNGLGNLKYCREKLNDIQDNLQGYTRFCGSMLIVDTLMLYVQTEQIAATLNKPSIPFMLGSLMASGALIVCSKILYEAICNYYYYRDTSIYLQAKINDIIVELDKMLAKKLNSPDVLINKLLDNYLILPISKRKKIITYLENIDEEAIINKYEDLIEELKTNKEGLTKRLEKM